MGAVDFAIITIREDEFEAVLDRVGAETSWSMLHGPRTGRIYNQCQVPGSSPGPVPGSVPRTVVAVRCLEQGNTEAQNVARDLLEDIDPQWIFVVGIAGGVATDEFTLGDVVISNRIHDFSVEAVQRDGEREYAVSGGPIEPAVGHVVANLPAMKGALGAWHDLGLARPGPPQEFYGDDAFQRKVRESIAYHFDGEGAGRPPRFKTGAIMSSDRLVKNAELVQVWLKVARQARAIEMESAGVYRATRGRNKPFLAIRGISDIVGARRNDDWTRYACHSAAAFTRALITAWPLAPAERNPGPTASAIGGRHLEAELARLLADMFAPRDLYQFLRLQVSRALVDSLPSPDHASRTGYAAEAADQLISQGLFTRAFLDAWAGKRENRSAEIQGLARWLG